MKKGSFMHKYMILFTFLAIFEHLFHIILDPFLKKGLHHCNHHCNCRYRIIASKITYKYIYILAAPPLAPSREAVKRAANLPTIKCRSAAIPEERGIRPFFREKKNHATSNLQTLNNMRMAQK